MRELETGYLSADAFDASWIARRDGPEGLTLVEYHGTHRGELVVPAGREQEPVVALAQDLFRDRDDITSVIVPEGVRRMDLWAFADSRSIRRVELPSTLEEIPPYAFVRCAALEEVRLAPGIRALRAAPSWSAPT